MWYDNILIHSNACAHSAKVIYIQPILKRRIAILRSMSKEADAISALVEFLEAFPTDTEAWCELSGLYMGQGLGDQAIFCLEEALLMLPHSWNVCCLLVAWFIA
jgi:tetratricopeptide (TPR) repeat protein